MYFSTNPKFNRIRLTHPPVDDSPRRFAPISQRSFRTKDSSSLLTTKQYLPPSWKKLNETTTAPRHTWRNTEMPLIWQKNGERTTPNLNGFDKHSFRLSDLKA